MDINTVIGSAAALCTTIANFPQLKKCWDTGKAGDLSLKMFVILTVGLILWAVYGVMQNDYVIITANIASLAMVLGILFYVLRERFPLTFVRGEQGETDVSKKNGRVLGDDWYDDRPTAEMVARASHRGRVLVVPTDS